MRILTLAGLSAAALAFAASSTGCYALGGDCKLNYNCESTGGAGGGGGSGATGGGGGAPPSCVPANNSTPVGNECGVFVSSTKGEDSNPGTKEKPFATIATALTAANGGPVYLCGEPLLESVELTSKTEIYGGLDCETDWKYDAAAPTTLTASGDMIPLRVSSKTTAELFDVVIRADDAQVPGGSSVALIAEGDADVRLTRCKVEAGNGKNGEDGDDFLETAAEGNPGIAGGLACSAGTVITPNPVAVQCGELQSIGGIGGIGTESVGGAGNPGSPLGTPNGGKGEELGGSGAACTDATPGDPGAIGAPGDGATALGSLQAGQGFVGSIGADGKPGLPGQGGGGGGGAKGGTGASKCTMPGSAGGASGGSGGSGGCGGQGGKGGGAGGASIGIISLGAKLTFSDVTIESKSGGKGGNGGVGQLGGEGGTGGLGGSKANFNLLKNGCNGGVGGKGGNGGTGGGGRGGHSIGIAHNGTPPDMTGATITTGAAGNGGTGEGETGAGAPGTAQKAQEFN